MKLLDGFDPDSVIGVPFSEVGRNFRGLIALQSDARYIELMIQMLKGTRVDLLE